MSNLYTISVTGPSFSWDARLEADAIMRLTELKSQAPEGSNPVLLSGGARGFDAAMVQNARDLNIPAYILFPNTTYQSYYWLSDNEQRGWKADPDGLEAMIDAANESGGRVLDPACGSNIYVMGADGNRLHANFARNIVLMKRASVVLVGAKNRIRSQATPGTSHAVGIAEGLKKRIVFLDADAPVPTVSAVEDPWAI